jgi:hypothetical protein
MSILATFAKLADRFVPIFFLLATALVGGATVLAAG